MVILLHRSADLRPRAIINSRHRPVMVHHIRRGKSDKPPAAQTEHAFLRSRRHFKSKLILVASLLGRTLLLALVLILILVHPLKLLHVELLEVTAELERLGYKRGA